MISGDMQLIAYFGENWFVVVIALFIGTLFGLKLLLPKALLLGGLTLLGLSLLVVIAFSALAGFGWQLAEGMSGRNVPLGDGFSHVFGLMLPGVLFFTGIGLVGTLVGTVIKAAAFGAHVDDDNERELSQ